MIPSLDFVLFYASCKKVWRGDEGVIGMTSGRKGALLFPVFLLSAVLWIC
jgi:hypothetical protein